MIEENEYWYLRERLPVGYQRNSYSMNVFFTLFSELPSLSSLSSLPAPLRTLSSLPAPALVRHRYRRRQLLAVGANAIRLAPGVGLRLSNDWPPRSSPKYRADGFEPPLWCQDTLRRILYVASRKRPGAMPNARRCTRIGRPIGQ